MFYKNQREEAEAGAAKGDRNSAAKAAKIYSKLSEKDDAGPLGFVRGALMPSENQRKRDSYVNEAGGGRVFGKIQDVISDGARTAIAGEALGGLGGLVGKFASRFAPKAATGTGISEAGASAVKASKGARQDLGKASPVKKALEAKKPAVSGSKSYEIKGGGTTKPSKMDGKELKALNRGKNAKGADGAELKPSGKAASSPTKRESTVGNRYNPQKGNVVGRKPPGEVQRNALDRQVRNSASKASGAVNKQASLQTPRSRAIRNNEALGKPGSVSKGKYESGLNTLKKQKKPDFGNASSADW